MTDAAVNRNVLLIEDEGEICLLLNLILDHANLNIEHIKTLAAADAAAADFALEAGADAFLSKPFSKATLLASVNSLLS
jgi:DNA-binding response OmpR family regulator